MHYMLELEMKANETTVDMVQSTNESCDCVMSLNRSSWYQVALGDENVHLQCVYNL